MMQQKRAHTGVVFSMSATPPICFVQYFNRMKHITKKLSTALVLCSPVSLLGAYNCILGLAYSASKGRLHNFMLALLPAKIIA